MREAGIEADVWDHQSDAVRSEDAQTIRAGRLQHGLRPRPETCRQNDCGARSLAAEIVDQPGTAAGGVAITARSGASGRSFTDA